MLFKLNCYGPPAYFDTKFPTLSEARQVLAGEDLWGIASLGIAIAMGVARAHETLHCGGKHAMVHTSLLGKEHEQVIFLQMAARERHAVEPTPMEEPPPVLQQDCVVCGAVLSMVEPFLEVLRLL